MIETLKRTYLIMDDLENVLEFIEMIESVFSVQAKAIMVDGVVVLHEGEFQQKRVGVVKLNID